MTIKTPAVIYADAATFARGRENAAHQYAANITNPPQCPGEQGLLDDLLHGRRAAARMEADVWGRYAEEMERRFADTADAEMQQADRDEAAQETRPRPPLDNTVSAADVALSFLDRMDGVGQGLCGRCGKQRPQGDHDYDCLDGVPA